MLKALTLFLLCVAVAHGALSKNYDTLSASEKRDQLWQRTSQAPYTDLPKENPGVLTLANLFLPSATIGAFTSIADELGSEDRPPKLVRPFGTVAKVRMQIFPNSTYTGIWKSGSAGLGLIRMSVAQYDMEAFTPGLALKILIDGPQPSANVFAMYNFDGQGSNLNFFENNFWNIVVPPTSIPLKLVNKAFALAIKLIPGGISERPESEKNLPLQTTAEVEVDGTVVTSPIAPYGIIMKPNKDLGWNPATNVDFRTHLGYVPEGLVLYTIAVRGTPEGIEETIGQLITESAFVASRYGDSQLFFQHHGRRWKPAQAGL